MNEAHDRREKLERQVGLQRAAMLFEAFWQKAHWPLMVLALAAIVVLSGVLNSLAGQHRLAVLFSLAILFVGALVPAFKLAFPSRYQAMRRMEQEAAVEHRSVSSTDESLVEEFEDDEQRVIWEEHKRRQLLQAEHVTVSKPRSNWRAFDPMALRVPLALGVIVAALLGTGEFSRNLVAAVNPPPPVTLNPVTVDAWVRPPAYTGKPPLLLTSPAMRDKRATNPIVEVPIGSSISLRVNNAKQVEPRYLSPAGAPLENVSAKIAKTDNGATGEVTVAQAMTLEILADGKAVESFVLSTIPDAPPRIVIPKPTEVAERGGLTVHWEVNDDYGVKAIGSELSLTDEQDGGIGFEGNGIFLWDAPKFEVRLKRPNTRDEKGKTTQDLTAHPWAGFRVSLQLTATDGAGQSTQAEALTFNLPERPFLRPLSRALIEQRKQLIIEPDKAPDVARIFDLILAYPKGLTERSAYLVRLAAISSRLENSGDYDEIKEAITDLWQLAVDIDEGSLADARAELKALKEELERAIREGAPPEKIAELSRRMREAMNRLMDQMQAERQQRQKNGQPQDQQQRADGKPITQEDLQKMMDAIEELSKQGAQDQAQALLDELDRILQNLQMGDQDQANGDRGQMQELMDQLGEMMRRQQELMDETQRMPNGGEGDEQGDQGQGPQDGQQPGDQGQGDQQMGENGQGQSPNGRPRRGRGPGGMAQEQGELGQMLDRMMRELGQDSPQQFGDARRGMGGAEQDLRGSNREGALRNQGDAMRALREGAGELGRRMREQARRGQGQNGRDGNRDGEGAGRDDNDPLGRPRATRNPDIEGPEKDIVPSELAMRRAREILEMLRNRANEGSLTDTERGYIDRLLRGLY